MQATLPFQFDQITRGLRSRALTGLASALAALGFVSASASSITLVGWEVNGQSAYGASPLAPSTISGNLSSSGLTRGSGVGNSGTAAGNAWGGNGFNVADLSSAVSADKFATFTIAPAENFEVSLDSIEPYNIRRSGTGPTTGQWQYSLDGTNFTNIGSAITWGSTTSSSGNLQSAITLSGIAELQNVAFPTVITLRVVPYGASGSGGTWYVNNFQTGNDLVVLGTVTGSGADETAPEIVSLSPEDGSTDVAVDTTLSIEFDESVQAGFGSVVLYQGASVVETFDISTEAVFTGNTVTFTPTADLDFNTAYHVIVPDSAIEDLSENAFAGLLLSTDWDFTTASNAPVVVSLSPADGATDVSVDTDLTVTFDQNIQAGTGDLEIYNASTDSLVESIPVTSGMITNDTLTATLASPLSENTTYYVLLDSGAVENLDNDAFGGITSPTDWVFTTEISGYIVDFEGADETKGSYASGTVTLNGLDWNMTEVLIGTDANDYKNDLRSARLRGYGTSSMSMVEDKTVGAGTISFDYRRYGTDAQVAWVVEYSTNGGVDWDPVGSPFTAPATNDVQTFSETLNVAGNVRFRIIQDGTAGTANRRLNIDDIVITDFGPDEFNLVSLSPENNATEVSISTPLTLNFTKPAVAATGNVELFASSDPINPVESFLASSGSFSGSSVTFTPTSPLAYDTEYFVTVDDEAFTDASENAFAGISSSDWTFQTEPEPAPQPPLVVRLAPEADSIGLPAGDLFLEIEYDVDVVRGSGLLQVFDFDDLDFPPTPVASFDVTDTDEVIIDGNIVSFATPVAVEGGKTYYVSGPAGLFRSSIGNIDSEPFGDDINVIFWSFEVAVPDTTPPSLVSTSPQNGGGASVSPNLSATFDEAVSFGAGPWTVTVYDVTADETVIEYTEASVSGISVGGNQVAITLPAGLEFENTYRVTFTAGVVEDASGNLSSAITGSEWEFTTGGPFVAGQVVISQVYGGGGNSGATLRNDFIELHNLSDAPISLSGWSVQYASSTGTSWSKTDLTGTIQANGYYLVQQAQGSGGSVDLPTPDDVGTLAMSGTNGKVALVNSTTSLTGANPSTDPSVSDFVGYGSANGFEGTGAAPGLSNTTAAIRGQGGTTDSNDNAADFTAGTPAPRNSSSPPYVPAADGSGVAVASNATPSAGTLQDSVIFPSTAASQEVRIELEGTFIGATLEEVEITVPSDFGAPLTGNIALSGTGLGSGSAVASGQIVTITGLSLTETTGLSVVISGLTAPDVSINPSDDGVREFTVRTASTGGSLAAILASPTVRVALPVDDLADLRAVTLPSPKAYLVPNEVVVTYVEENAFRNQHYIQDATAGILIDDQPVTLGTSFMAGDGLENLVGSLTEFQGMLQFNPIAATADLSSTSNPILPIVVTLADLTASPLTYQSRLVRVDGVSFQSPSGNFTSNSVHTLEQGADTFAFRTFFDADYADTAVPADSFNLVAISRTLSDSSPCLSARSLADFLPIDPDPEPGYLDWATLYAGGETPDGDFDGDGIPNGVEYFFGETAPGFTPAPAIVNGSISYPRDSSLTDVTFTVQTSPDLADWDDVLVEDLDLSNPNFVTYDLDLASGRLFVRIAVDVAAPAN